MKHIHLINSLPLNNAEKFTEKATGKYYTDEKIALLMIEKLLPLINAIGKKNYNIADPFSGDGRLVTLLIKQWMLNGFPDVEWNVYLFDIEHAGLVHAKSELAQLKLAGASINVTVKNIDIFYEFENYIDYFDCVITNPPWENIKPDSRELNLFEPSIKLKYIESLREFDDYLSRVLPYSQPKRKFAGWGTNLSRVGAELSLEICNKNGMLAIVMPASFFADEQSFTLRQKFFNTGRLDFINYYPAEAKLFNGADVSSCSFILIKDNFFKEDMQLSVYDKKLNINSFGCFDFSSIDTQHLSIPISQGVHAIHLLKRLQEEYSTWNSLEKNGEIWAGREIDETGSSNWTKKNGDGYLFVKGKMIGRYNFDISHNLKVTKKIDKVPSSSNFERIAWRDISRPSQKRRVIATVIPPNSLAGNSLGVVYYQSGSQDSLFSLLGIINSLCFEFQLRSFLATGHVSLSALRKTAIPSEKILSQHTELKHLVISCMNGCCDAELKVEAYIAKKIYKLNLNEFNKLLSSFDKIELAEKENLLRMFQHYG
ncbi:Alw26I/Eco31I/Esp3I family type II restriction adenine-specific DNA-methyltransferase [Buttiauxella sp. A111]|uniref:Alw26I/Eco31I/Esp3I family type II restriction adenine-specific DNA-methyltransferase n=1 Tax=Buttiauxella sp. A111 TaxID=2563088 RepID=UPI0010E1CDAC|nr:Alw26I/Eco31I/Esp3I family type II restriction adenine-specific DNA-methyltransferase [Buttiauxella sp. A111]GDX07540.1 Alw26I/Eco31I/Esp3I family type II restriction adenine-specific DNA-methyltransferase [Buttiauxella sp. A111]